MRAILSIAILLYDCLLVFAGEGIPIARLENSRMDSRLLHASQLWQESKFNSAIKEFEKQLDADSTLLAQIAIITGGNYHLTRLTDNVLADRVGGFSPSGSKLVFSRDTFMVCYDDGLFDWVEKKKTGIVYYDFDMAKEIHVDIPVQNGLNPRFRSDTSFFYIDGGDTASGHPLPVPLMLYDIPTGTSSVYCSLNGYDYCPCEDGIILYDRYEDSIVMKNMQGSKNELLYDNNSFLSFRRPLAMLRNFSTGNNIIMFQTGFYPKNIYGIPLEGGAPQVQTNRQITWRGNSLFCPAAVGPFEFAYLAKNITNTDIFYHVQDKDYRLTFDGGDKQNLAISPDGMMIAFSYKLREQYLDSFEIFILDFSRDAGVSDLKYRFSNAR